MLRRALLALSENRRARELVLRNPLARRAARRFVAGETLDDALAAADRLATAGFLTSLNLLGERTVSGADAEAAAVGYEEILERLRDRTMDCYVAVKLTQLGLDVSEDLASRLLRRILERARPAGTLVRIDMEHSMYVDATLRILKRLRGEGFEALGAVIQAYLYRSAQDLEHLLALGIPIRLVKGAYMEPAAIAYPKKRDVDAAYERLMRRLLTDAGYHAIATHDERLIRAALRFAHEQGRAPEAFEFQMIYGVRRDLQEWLRREGARIRVYIPFGVQWYPYFMRRLAERPANLMFLLRNIVRG